MFYHTSMFSFTTQRTSNKFKLSKVYGALQYPYMCLIVFEVSCESFSKFLFIIMGYYSVSKLEKCHFQMMAINSIYNDGSIKISPQSFNKLYFKTFSVGKLLILIIKIHVLLWFYETNICVLLLFVEDFFSS